MEPPPPVVPVNSQSIDASPSQPQSSAAPQPQLQQQRQQEQQPPTPNFPQQQYPSPQQQPNPNLTPQQPPPLQQPNPNLTQQQPPPQQLQQQKLQPSFTQPQLQQQQPTPNFSQQQQLKQQQQHQQHTSSPKPPSTNFPQQQQQQSNQQQPYRVSFNAGTQPVWMGSQPQSGSQYAQFPPSSAPLRGGIAIGVPSQHISTFGPRIPVNTHVPDSRPPMPSTSLGVRNPVNNMPDSRSQMPGTANMGSQVPRPGGVSQPLSQSALQRPVLAATSGTRPPSTTTPPQKFQSQGIFRASSAALTNTSTQSTSQGQQSSYQPWLSAQHGRPPLPSQSFRPQVASSPSQQRSHIPQQSLQPMQASSQTQQLLSSPQQQQHLPASNLPHEIGGQQLPSSRIPQSLTSQQNVPRVHGSSSLNPPSPGMGQASIAAGPMDKTGGSEAVESCNRILSKRSILELVSQVDPSEKLDPEVEDVLVDIAEDFIDSVATFGCSLAKHRKSNTLEAKDILLHLERTWNMTLPGFSGDEIRTYKKPVVNDIHKERLAVIRKSQTGGEINKSSGGQATGNAKGTLAKVTPTIIGS